MEPFDMLKNPFRDNRHLLLWTLWRSGTHWLGGMIGEMTGFKPWYHSDDSQNYKAETIRKINSWPTRRLLIRHVCLLPEELLHISESQNFNIIFLYRDPRDVIASNVNMRKHVEGYRPGMPPFPEMSIYDILKWELDTYGDFYRRQLLTWIQADHPRLHKIRYEDLSLKTCEALNSIAKFLCLDVSEHKIRSIVDHYDFKRQARRDRGQEDKSAHNRKGIIGDYRSQFSKSELDLINYSLGDSLSITGYIE